MTFSLYGLGHDMTICSRHTQARTHAHTHTHTHTHLFQSRLTRHCSNDEGLQGLFCMRNFFYSESLESFTCTSHIVCYTYFVVLFL